MKSLEFTAYKMAREQAKKKVYIPPILKTAEERIDEQDAREIYNCEMARKLIRKRREANLKGEGR